jgi:uncharacterized phage protein (TIGR01671 family)
MRGIKFKFIFQYKEANITHVSRAYTLDELVGQDRIITTEEIADECLSCDCKPEGESLYAECSCDEIFDHFELIERVEWSGLKDKNGVEIYEGDILQENNSEYSMYVVKWDEQYARFKLDSEPVSKAIQYPEWNRGVKMDIIGNIYENPELLNKQQ